MPAQTLRSKCYELRLSIFLGLQYSLVVDPVWEYSTHCSTWSVRLKVVVNMLQLHAEHQLAAG